MSASQEPRPRSQALAGTSVLSLVLLVAAVGALGLIALSDLFSLIAGFRLRALFDVDGGFVTAPEQELAGALSLYERADRYQVILYVPTAVVFIAWFFRMRRDTGLLAPDRFRNGPGWAVGAWLIPLVNLWMPYRVAFDMWSAATLLPADGERYRARMWPVNLWWALFVLSGLFHWIARAAYEDAESPGEIRDGVTQYMIADAVHIAAAAAAVYFAVRLTVMQRLKATRGPFEPAIVKGAAA